MDKLISFTVRLPEDLWFFVKIQSAKQHRSMQEIVNECLEKYKKKHEKKLTDSDTMV